MRVLLFGTALGGINVMIYSLGEAYSVSPLGRAALVFVATAVSMMAAVALDPSRQVRRITRGMMAAAGAVMSLLTTQGLADGLFREEDNGPADMQVAAVPISLDDGPFDTIEGREAGKIVLVVKNK